MSVVTVIGSINVDMTAYVDRIPQRGENIVAKNFLVSLGGKGANQAVAAARCGARVNLLGCVGGDRFGADAVEHLRKNGVDVSSILVEKDGHTGTAMINVENHENSLSVYLGANSMFTVDRMKHLIGKINEADVVLIQNEIPSQTIEYALSYCSSHHIMTVLNPAPDAGLTTQEWIDEADYIIPNIHEYKIIFHDAPLEETLKAYRRKLIVTMGTKGVAYFDGECSILPPFEVETVDPTGAGDTFNGVFAYAMSEGVSFHSAIAMANVAAGLSTAKKGCQDAMPYWSEIESHMHTG